MIAQMTSPWVHSTGTPSFATASSSIRARTSPPSDPSARYSAVADRQAARASQRPQGRQTAFRAARDEQRRPRFRLRTSELAQACPERAGVEPVDQGACLPYALARERPLELAARPSLPRFSVTVAHDVHRNRRHYAPFW